MLCGLFLLIFYFRPCYFMGMCLKYVLKSGFGNEVLAEIFFLMKNRLQNVSFGLFMFKEVAIE